MEPRDTLQPLDFSPPSDENFQIGKELLRDEPRRKERLSVWQRIGADHRNFYDAGTLSLLGAGVAGHAVLANTNADEWLRAEYQEQIRSLGTDEWSEFFHSPKVFGDGT